MKKLLLYIVPLIIFSSAMNADKYDISVCKVVIFDSGISSDFIDGKAYHVYVKSTIQETVKTVYLGSIDGKKIKTIHFGFDRKKYENNLQVVKQTAIDKDVDSEIYFEDKDRKEAECVSVYSTDNEKDYKEKWSKINDTYDANKKTRYALRAKFPAKNCDVVAEEAIEAAELSWPESFATINGRNARGIVNLIQGDRSIKNIARTTKATINFISDASDNCRQQ